MPDPINSILEIYTCLTMASPTRNQQEAAAGEEARQLHKNRERLAGGHGSLPLRLRVIDRSRMKSLRFPVSAMEAVAGKGARSSAGGSDVTGGDHPKAVPGYLRPAAGSCHYVCKYGGQHTFGENDHHARKPQPAKPLRQPPAASDGPHRRAPKPLLLKARSVSRRRVVDSSKPEKADAPTPVEWKDIVAYEDSSAKSEDTDGCMKKKEAMKGKKSRGNYGNKIAGEEESGVMTKKKSESMNKKLVKSVRSKLSGMAPTKPQSASKAASPSLKNSSSAGGKSVKPPPPRAKRAAASPAEKKIADQQMVREDDEATATDAKEGEPIVAVETLHPLDQEHAAAAAEERSRPIPAHRRARSMSMISLSSRSVRFPFVRQASRSSGTTAFNLRSRSTKAPSDQEAAPARERLRFRSKARAAAGEEPAGTSSGGGGVQLRTRSHRRRGSFGGGFVVPAVALRHQKTLEKKRSRRLHNAMIEETASRLAKTRKSRVKALVGAFETLISKIGK